MRSISLRKEPSVRQIDAILRHLDEELTKRGAMVTRTGMVGKLRFRMPRPWKAPRLGILLAVTSGQAEVSAGSGGPWRVRYRLSFSVLRAVVILLSLGLVAYGLSWPDRSNLINALLVLWVVAFGVPYVAASARFRRIIESCAVEVVERRRAARHSGEHPTAPDPSAGSEPSASGVEIRPTE